MQQSHQITFRICSTRMISWQRPTKQQSLVACRFWRWQLESSPLCWARFQTAPKYEWDEWQCGPTRGRGKARKSLGSGAAAPGSQHKRLPKARNVHSLLESGFSTGHVWAAGLVLREGHGHGGKPILCDSHVTSVPRASLHLSTLADTCAKAEDLNRWGQGRGQELVWTRLPSWHAALQQGLEESFTVRVPRINGKSINAVQLLTWIALTCLTETGTGCQG